jgi:outer membrane protein TolC
MFLCGGIMKSLAFSVAATLAALITFVRNGSMRRIPRPFYPCALLLAGALCANLVAGAEAPLTLAEAQRRAVERSYQIPAQDAAVSASREMAVAAGQLPDPVLKLGLDNVPADGADQFSLTRDFMTQRRVGISQEIVRSDKRHLRADRYEREAQKALAEKIAITAATQRDTALAWLDLYYAQAMSAVLVDQAKEVRLEIIAAESAYRAGRGSQADLFAAQGVLAGLEERTSEFNRRITTARIRLARWVGDRAQAPLGDRPAMDAVRLNADALELQLGHHPDIAVLSRQIEVANADVRIAQANKKADWSVELSYAVRGPAYSNMVSIGLSVPLQWDQRTRQDRELGARLAVVEQVRAQRDDLLRAHVAEVDAMLREWDNGRERQTRYQREIIPLARERTRAALTAFKGGKAGLTDLLLARRSEIDLSLQALQLEQDTARLWAQLNFLIPVDEPAHAAYVPASLRSGASK